MVGEFAYPGASCVMCGTKWEGVGVFCGLACMTAFANWMQADRERYLANPDNIRPGDRVRLKTAAERA